MGHHGKGFLTYMQAYSWAKPTMVASMLQDPNAPRTRANPQLMGVKSMHTTSKPLSPRHRALPPLNGNGTNGHSGGNSPERDITGTKRGSPDSPLEDLDGNLLSKSSKAARTGV